jgi:hypothetical protein
MRLENFAEYPKCVSWPSSNAKAVRRWSKPSIRVAPLTLSVALAVRLKHIAHAAVSEGAITNRGVADVISSPPKCLNAIDLAQASRHAGLLGSWRRYRAQDGRIGRLDPQIGGK